MTLYDIPFTTMDGAEMTLAEHERDVVLVVNVASRCGLAPQYATLEELQKRYQDRGFTVLGFPSNQFLQEYGSNEKIAEFCSMTYGVTFPVLDRVRLNGRHTHPLYAELKKTADDTGHSGKIRWNFEKFLVLPGGDVRRYAPKTLPDDPAIVREIEAHLPR
ncbi:glutathione peroxidase [Promicromonospora citrea]|uniref:Glutathione peroxidase n=1 Tax=Promicromonospora citrea TaxID=43677 RepID=A0A8H9L1A8_9MICO|nr:glutathione peroxidase [Promicromonospora citrea]NNH51657.1 glutathione peroxidase [Promicromonospora citrea]GGM12637.1 glutathione peroxidase [Promicromonospora citrea]